MSDAADFPFDAAVRFTAADDQLHAPGRELDWTETTWWSFYVPERSLGGWLYAQVRPNLGTVTGGAFVYDPTAWLPWELPFYGYQYFQPLPEALDLRDVRFRTGVSVKVLEPGMRYELGYRFRDQTDFVAELLFEGLTPPVPHLHGAPPFVGSSHYDQHGRVTGSLRLRGETIEVDHFAVRDRSWGRRPELLGRRGRLSYAFGTVDAGEAFLAFCLPPADDPWSEVEHLSTGYLLRDGKLRRLVAATRRVPHRHPSNGPQRIEIEGTDTDGRTFRVTGEGVSRMFVPKSTVCINTMIRWDLDGREGWGEDQDLWPTPLLGDLAQRRARPADRS